MEFLHFFLTYRVLVPHNFLYHVWSFVHIRVLVQLTSVVIEILHISIVVDTVFHTIVIPRQRLFPRSHSFSDGQGVHNSIILRELLYAVLRVDSFHVSIFFFFNFSDLTKLAEVKVQLRSLDLPRIE